MQHCCCLVHLTGTLPIKCFAFAGFESMRRCNPQAGSRLSEKSMALQNSFVGLQVACCCVSMLIVDLGRCGRHPLHSSVPSCLGTKEGRAGTLHTGCRRYCSLLPEWQIRSGPPSFSVFLAFTCKIREEFNSVLSGPVRPLPFPSIPFLAPFRQKNRARASGPWCSLSSASAVIAPF